PLLPGHAADAEPGDAAGPADGADHAGAGRVGARGDGGGLGVVPAQRGPWDAGLTRAEAGAQVRVSALRQAAGLAADGVAQGSRTLAFVRSRRGAEVVAAMARRTLAQVAPELVDRVAAYRAGYLREERRSIERALLAGELLGLASTNALELGVDLVGL